MDTQPPTSTLNIQNHTNGYTNSNLRLCSQKDKYPVEKDGDESIYLPGSVSSAPKLKTTGGEAQEKSTDFDSLLLNRSVNEIDYLSCLLSSSPFPSPYA